MPDSKRFLHPEAIKRIVAARDCALGTSSKGFSRGMHRSPYFGQSVEFLQHREYAPATTCATSTGKSGPSKTASTSSSSRKTRTSAARCWSTSRSSMQYGSRPAEQVRLRLPRSPSAWPICCCGSKTPSAAWPSTKRSASTVPHAHQAQPLATRSFRRSTSASRATRPICTPILRGVAESYPRRGHDGPDLRPAGRSRRPVQGLQAAAAARARRDGVPRDGRRRARFPVQRPTRFEGLELPST